jgi:uncharacterized membrane protein YoaK (UPF0700 family)
MTTQDFTTHLSGLSLIAGICAIAFGTAALMLRTKLVPIFALRVSISYRGVSHPPLALDRQAQNHAHAASLC